MSKAYDMRVNWDFEDLKLGIELNMDKASSEIRKKNLWWEKVFDPVIT